MNLLLIVSYSYSGNIHQIAQKLQEVTSGDWCEIHPRQPLSDGFSGIIGAGKTGNQKRLLSAASS